MTKKAKALYYEERKERKTPNGGFLSRGIAARADAEMSETAPELRTAGALERVVKGPPIDIIERLDPGPAGC